MSNQLLSGGKILPRIVYQACVHGALLVGSFARKMMGEDVKVTHDYDLLVPLENWQKISLMIPETAKPNKFGGWRFTDEKGNEIDIWPDTVHKYLQNCLGYGGKLYAIDFIRHISYSSEIIKN